jgi:sortase A
MRRAAIIVALGLLASGATLLGRDAYLAAKGALAGRLVERALAAHLADGDRHRPWDWADFAPIARLDAPRLGVSRPVLTGASGESLAFGLGHVDGTADPGAPGHVVLAGHRDSWATFLGDLQKGDRIQLISHSGTSRYEVIGMQIVDEENSTVLDEDGFDRMTLLTCYPLTGYKDTSQRYLIICDRLQP